MSLKSGFGGAKNMNGPRGSKPNSGKTKANFGRAGTGAKRVSGYKGTGQPGGAHAARKK